jgi:hypothetical protein
MTKEKLIDHILFLPMSKAMEASILRHLNEFFNSNVVIPRGDDRHPCADVLHLMAEGLIEAELSADDGNTWSNVHKEK